MLHEDFQKVLDEYLKAREENGYTSAPIAHHIQKTLKSEIADLVEDSSYEITASAGAGRLSEMDWLKSILCLGIFAKDTCRYLNNEKQVKNPKQHFSCIGIWISCFTGIMYSLHRVLLKIWKFRIVKNGPNSVIIYLLF